MPRRELSLDIFTESIASVHMYKRNEFSGSTDYKRVLKILSLAIEKELTKRQRQCVIMYYSKNMTMTKVADDLGLSTSTVCRHIQKARKRLHHVLDYYFNS